MESPAEEFFRAKREEAPVIARFVNEAYRGEASKRGWTTEADLLGGQRTDEREVSTLIAPPASIILCRKDREGLLGTIHILLCAGTAHFGMLAVRPSMQGRGIGKSLLREAEKIAVDAHAMRAEMAVLTFRRELLSFYERLGYARTGIFRDFPEDPRFGVPKVTGLRFEILEKPIRA